MYKMIIPIWLEVALESGFETIVETTEDDFEAQGSQLRPVCHEGYDGFIPYTNGGTEFTAFLDLNFVTGSGQGFVDASVTKQIDDIVENCYNDARSEFIDQHRDELLANDAFTAEILDAKSDDVNYHELYELDLGDLAETLSEHESGWLEGTFFIQHRIQFYEAANPRNETGSDEICFLSGVNLDFDYGRDKGLEVTYENTVKVTDLKTREQVESIFKEMLASI